MKAAVLLTAAVAACANARNLDARQRQTTRPGSIPDVSSCGLDAFVGHTSEALLFCSSLLKQGGGVPTTKTATVTAGTTTTIRTTVYTTLYPPTSTPPTSTPKPPTSTPPITSTPTSGGPSPTSSCGVVGYAGATAAYYFDSSGTKNNFAACSAACKADAKCKSFGYGEANCLLFDISCVGNTNYNPMSPYTFYDATCPKELPVRKREEEKRQIISIGLPGGTPGLSSACSCLITSAPGGGTIFTSVTVRNTVTTTQTVTRTVSLLPDGGNLVFH